MNDGNQIFDAKQYFEELQRVVIGISHDGLNQIADILVKANESGRMVYLFGNGVLSPSNCIRIAENWLGDLFTAA